MDISIIKNFPIGIKEQVKRQIKSMIEDHRLKAGEMLLSANDMGALLNINRNTVASVFKELEKEGFLKVIKGSGTFVKNIQFSEKRVLLKEIFNRAYEETLTIGFSADDINDLFITELLKKSKDGQNGGTIILIDCNYEVLEALDKKIKARCKVESHLMLIQDVEEFPGKFMRRAKGSDLIICGMNHMEDLKSAVPDLPAETIAFIIREDFQVMNQILQLPVGTSVGYCCISEKSSKSFFKTTLLSAGSSLDQIHVGINDIKGIKEMIDICDIVFATHYVYDDLIAAFPLKKKIHRVKLDIDSGNLDFIISKLGKARP